MANQICTKSVGELWNGEGKYTFYIPAYQRGYRWNEFQVKSLLKDLYAFVKDNKDNKDNSNKGKFYCLQPVIVKEIKDQNKIDAIRKQIGEEDIDNRKIYEVIDGQQRLTAIYLILRYMIANCFFSEEMKSCYLKSLYRLTFETREEMYGYLRRDSLITDTGNHKQTDKPNIDEYHVQNTITWTKAWITNEYSKCTNILRGNIERDILELLFQNDKSESPNAKFIWYEITDDKDPVKEFLSVNNGKIPLTESELIKALFLQKRNFQNDGKNLKQIERALEWERMENTLHRDDFWYFLTSKKVNPANRIELILRLTSGKFGPGDFERNVLFGEYYDKFENKSSNDLEEISKEEWDKVVGCFRVLEDWYLDPIKYNMIGYLVHSGKSIYDIYVDFKEYNKESGSSRKGFQDRLKEMIRETIKGLEISENGFSLNKNYKQQGEIRKVLLLLNINSLNEQLNNSKVGSASSAYKFPFDVYVNQSWDVEHIDSQTMNIGDKIKWIEDNKGCVHDLSEEENERFVTAFSEEEWDECIKIIREKIGESDDEMKDEIGNLTLLDSETNRSYGNAIFPRKQERILEEIRKGKYVPYCTQMVFYKNFDIDRKNLPRWDTECKKAYGKYVCEQLKSYLSL